MDSATQRREVSDYPNLDALSLFQDSQRCRINVECIAPMSFESRTNGPQNPKKFVYMFQVPGPPPTPPAMVMVITHQLPSPCGMGGPWEGAGVSQPPTNSNVTGRIR